MWQNEYTIEEWQHRFHNDTPNLVEGVQVLQRLVNWTNRNSDGWPYWNKPGKAADKLMDAIAQKVKDQREDGCVAREGKVVEFTDLTDAELKRLLSPIKAFLTRQNVPHTVLDPPPPPVRNLARFTTEDAEALIGRRLTESEYRSLVKTLENSSMGEVFAECVAAVTE